MDLGVQIDVDLYSIINESTELLVYTDPGCGYALWNGVMAASPKHPFIRACLNQIKHNVETCFYGKRDLEITGPLLVGKVYESMYGFANNEHLHLAS